MSVKTGSADQHNLLHQHWPQLCCLCRTEGEIVALRAQVDALNAQFKGVGIVPYLDRMKELADRLDEQRVHMEAWYKVFGTTQLTHAQAAMEAKDAENTKLRLLVDDQARLIGRLRAALEEGIVRHLELDRWTRERVEADPDAYIHVIRKALSPEPKEA